MIQIFLKEYRFRSTHGVFAEERSTEQTFVVSIVGEIGSVSGEKTDRIEDTVSYLDFKTVVDDIAESRSYYLIEALASDIADRIFEKDQRVATLSITIEKPDVLENGVVGITLSRAR